MKSILRKLLVDSLKLFYRRDAKQLFGCGKAIDERAMVGCIYRYMWHLLSRHCETCLPIFDIDVEYDRMNSINGEEIKKHMVVMPECDECLDKGKCIDLIKENTSDGKDNYNFRPDIIVHKRGSNHGKKIIL